MTDNNTPDPFLADGISLGIPNNSPTEIESIDNALFLDQDGNLHFRDNFTKTSTDINGDLLETVTLKDLYTRVKGVYTKDGQLFFKDSTVSRPYSLKEIVSAYTDWKNKLTTGGIFWIGTIRVNNSECNNIKVNIDGDPSLDTNSPDISGVGRIYVPDDNGVYPSNSVGTKVFSIDQYLSKQTEDFKLNTDGSWKWHTVPNLSLIIPPIDRNKSLFILAKTNVRLVKVDKPIVFRLYDETTGIELDRKAVDNDTEFSVEQQPLLSFVGTVQSLQDKITLLNCQCLTEDQQAALAEEPPHIISVQFHVEDQIEDISDNDILIDDTSSIRYKALERRLIGLPNNITDEPIVNSSIDVIIFDTNPSDAAGRKAGSLAFVNQDLMEVVFDTAFTSSDYSITLSCNKNINTWYTTKKSTGFIIRAEKKFNGTIDWIATKLKSQGDA